MVETPTPSNTTIVTTSTTPSTAQIDRSVKKDPPTIHLADGLAYLHNFQNVAAKINSAASSQTVDAGHSATSVSSLTTDVVDISTSAGVVDIQIAIGAHLSSTSVKVSHSVGVATPIKWQPPPVHCLKMNIDVAFDSSQKRIGLGIIIRDFSGCVKAAKSKLVRGCYKPHGR
ncbi:hypothetical protein CsatA_000820 [Cannabis sativa]